MDAETADADELAWNALAVLHTRVEQHLAKVLQRQHGLGLSDYRALGRLAAALDLAATDPALAIPVKALRAQL
jgi:hypothetical protein